MSLILNGRNSTRKWFSNELSFHSKLNFQNQLSKMHTIRSTQKSRDEYWYRAPVPHPLRVTGLFFKQLFYYKIWTWIKFPFRFLNASLEHLISPLCPSVRNYWHVVTTVVSCTGHNFILNRYGDRNNFNMELELIV